MKFSKVENSLELGYSLHEEKNPFLFPLYEEILKNFHEKYITLKTADLDLVQPKNGLTTKEIFDSLDVGQYVHYLIGRILERVVY